VQDSLAVCVLQTVGQELSESHGLLGLERSVALDPVLQRLALHQLHHEVVVSRLVPRVVDRDDLGVAEPTQRSGFFQEPPAVRPLGAGAGQQDLERHGSPQADVAGDVDRAHAALSEPALQSVGTELGREGQRFTSPRFCGLTIKLLRPPRAMG
jgi:hypothetical protein